MTPLVRTFERMAAQIAQRMSFKITRARSAFAWRLCGGVPIGTERSVLGGASPRQVDDA